MSLYVITGGPCVGKTTVISGLQKLGYKILPEFARLIIEEGEYSPWKDLATFQSEVIKRQKEAESKVNGCAAFCDRGLPDSVAYRRVYGLIPPKELVTECRSRYDRVFILDRLQLYENDSVRKEDPQTALRIHQEIERVYTELGYRVIKIPPIGIERRIELILREITR